MHFFFQTGLLDETPDRNNNGIIDEAGEKNLMTNFQYYDNTYTSTGNPTTVGHYYNYMRSVWKDSTHATFGGSGHITSAQSTNFMFPDIPSGGSGWTEALAGNLGGDRRILMGCGPFHLASGGNVEFEYAMVYSYDSSLTYNSSAYYLNVVTDVRKVKHWSKH